MFFKSIDDIRDYMPVNVTLEFNTIEPFIKIAERDYIKALIGKDLYDKALTHEGGSGSGSEGVPDSKMDELIELIKEAEINLALWRWSYVGSVSVRDSGIQRIESDKVKSAFKYQEDNFKDTAKQNGFDGLDAILEYLETNIDDFEDFEHSDNYTIFKNNLIPTAKKFNEWYFINNSRLVFLRVQRFMTEVEDLVIIPWIGRDLFDKVKNEYIINEFTGKNETLFELLQKTIAPLAIARGINTLNSNITDKGLFFEVKTGAGLSYKRQTNILDNQLDTVYKEALNTGNSYKESVRQYLLKNIDDFPLYENSDAYDDSEPGTLARDNDDKKTVWV